MEDVRTGNVGAGLVQRVQDTPGKVDDPRRRLAALLAAPGYAIISANLEGVITGWSEGAASTYGYAEIEALGQPLMLIIPPEQREEEAALLEQVREGTPLLERHTLRRTKAGTRIRMAISAAPLHDDEGKVVGLTTIERDETEDVGIETALRTANAALRRRRAEMQEFFSILAHDLKHPVVGIRGLLSMMRRDAAARHAEEDEQHLGLCIAECDHMQALLGHMSDFARISRTTPRNELVALAEVLERVVSPLRARMQDQQVRLALDGEATVVRLAAAMVVEALGHLVDNAMKYGCRGSAGAIEVGARVEGGEAAFWVSDQGPGIDPKHHERIFEPFRRLEVQAGQEGAGVGLSVARALTLRLGGEVRVESELGRGARFELRVPLDGTEMRKNGRGTIEPNYNDDPALSSSAGGGQRTSRPHDQPGLGADDGSGRGSSRRQR